MKRAARLGMGLGLASFVAMLPTASCSSDPAETPVVDAGHDVVVRDAPGAVDHDALPPISADALPPISADALPPGSYCSLPGSVVGTAQGMQVVPGGSASLPSLSWLTVPKGFCAHHFANVAETRQLRVSETGDVFAASPSTSTAGSENKEGVGAIVVLPDDDHDGLADSTLTFLPSLASTQGLTFAGGYLYFQDGTAIKRVAFARGDRTPSAAIENVVDLSAMAAQDSVHWPKAVDVAQDGTVYVTNGSDQGESCYTPAHAAMNLPTGTVFKVSPSGQASVVAKGFRNPIALRCEAGHHVCLVAELARDGSGASGGREKIVPVRQGDDWGFPCCATTNVAYQDMTFSDNNQPVQSSNCASVTPESVAFTIGNTPFGIDFEAAHWPAPWATRAFVTLHGSVGSYVGSRVVAIALDPTTGLPLPSSDLDGGAAAAPNMTDFVTGWDDGTLSHGRATAVAFAPDSRMYVGDDTKGEIFWVAPVGLMRP